VILVDYTAGPKMQTQYPAAVKGGCTLTRLECNRPEEVGMLKFSVASGTKSQVKAFLQHLAKFLRDQGADYDLESLVTH
jgi:hypothetical protein